MHLSDVALLEQLANFEMPDIRNTVQKVQELPFNSKRKLMATKILNPVDNKCTVYVKGAFERILEYSTSYLKSKGKKTEKLTEAQKATINECANSMASEGLRVLGFAKLTLSDSSTPLTEDLIKDLTFTGLIGMNDPPRPNVKFAIEQLLQGGVHIIMITGDSENTAVNIAKQIGIPVIDPKLSVLSGDKLDEMSDDQLANVIDHVNIFARATPEHKLNIVRALRKRGDVVAMTGDGVNDAPALNWYRCSQRSLRYGLN